jgi:nitrite reductase/ring-hydroxylating ferredoxin subunit
MSEAVFLCHSADLVNSGAAVSFQVRYYAENCGAFAVRYADKVYAYLNRCSHVPVAMDSEPNQFFDCTGTWLMCAIHGALYAPQTGQCVMGRCRGGLVKIPVTEAADKVHWHTSDKLQRNQPL